MAETLKKGPYEVLIRFNCEPGEEFGKVRGAHIGSLTFIVDDNGIIQGHANPRAQDLASPASIDELAKFLGDEQVKLVERIAGLSTELSAEKENHRKTARDLTEARVERDLAVSIIEQTQGAQQKKGPEEGK
jgi:hypothetical protein